MTESSQRRCHCGRFASKDSAHCPDHWEPGDPCAACGSVKTDWGESWQGAVCYGCGGSDADE